MDLAELAIESLLSFLSKLFKAPLHEQRELLCSHLGKAPPAFHEELYRLCALDGCWMPLDNKEDDDTLYTMKVLPSGEDRLDMPSRGGSGQNMGQRFGTMGSDGPGTVEMINTFAPVILTGTCFGTNLGCSSEVFSGMSHIDIPTSRQHHIIGLTFLQASPGRIIDYLVARRRFLANSTSTACRDVSCANWACPTARIASID